MTEFPRGVDLSRYQYSQDGSKKPNFDIINAKCAFVGVRAGISWGYADPWFSYTWEHLSVPRLAYHVIYPGEDAQRQVDHFLNIVKPGEHDRLVLDMELDHGYNKTRITDTLEQCLVKIWDETGHYPVIYSRASWVNQFLDVSRLPKLDWWLAGYRKRLPEPLYTPEATPPPALPNGVTNWLIHQTTDKGNGGEFGVASHYVDIDRWNTGNKEIAAFFGLTEELPPEPEPPEEQVKLFDAKVVTTPPNRLKTRYTPNGNVRPEADWLQSQAIVPVYETHSTGWWRVADEAWSSSTWMERVDDYPLPPATIIDIAPLCQKDSRWANIRLGNSYLTLGSDGCLATDFAMVIGVNPDEFNARLKAVGGFTGANIYWQMIDDAYPNCEYVWAYDCYYIPAPLNEIDKLLQRGISVMVHTLKNGYQHWVLIVGKNGDDYIINDPWDGVRCSFRERYGDPARWIYRIRAYRMAA